MESDAERNNHISALTHHVEIERVPVPSPELENDRFPDASQLVFPPTHRAV